MSDTKTNPTKPADDANAVPPNFIKDIIDADREAGKNAGRVATRFPPEPNGYLHIGHAKSICLNFGLAKEYGGTCNLRFDDTNPAKEEVEYVESIKADVRWLGFEWQEPVHFASDYFDQLYAFAVQMIKDGLAYVDDLSDEDIRDYRGNYYTAARPSPFRERPIEESLDLFARMKAGEFKDGEKVLRAKGDLTSANMNLRDPLMYRIRHASHHRTGDKWCIYPMYDWAHGQSDAIEGITHSICTLEFQDHRPLYDWFLSKLPFENPPRQIEFARLNLDYTVMSKRRFLQLVQEKYVSGWDDPRMPTLSGLRRRGYTPRSIRLFAERIGVARADSTVDLALLEYCIREDLNAHAPRVMAVLDPLKVVIDNFEEDRVEWFDAPLHPEDDRYGTRKLPLTREFYVEREDFLEEAPRKWHRLAPGKEVRLRYACLFTCTHAVKDAEGRVVELHGTWDPESKGGTSPDGRKVRGTLHWVSAAHAVDAEVRLYDRLFTVPNPNDTADGKTFIDHLNPESLITLRACKLEPHLAGVAAGERMQFERLGYFCVDPDSRAGQPVFNRTVTLRDTWARIQRSQQRDAKPPKAKKDKTPVQAETPSAPVREGLEPIKDEITIDDFAKLDLRVALVKEAGFVKGADRLLRLLVDLGEGRLRQIFAGIRESYPDPAVLVGQSVIVVANLKPRKMKFGLSEGMVLSGGTAPDKLVAATFKTDPEPGDTVS